MRSGRPKRGLKPRDYILDCGLTSLPSDDVRRCILPNMAGPKAQKAKNGKKAKFSYFIRSPLFKVLLSLFLFFFIGTSALVLYYYNYYSKVIDRRLSGEIFKNTAQIYAAPYRIYPGQRLVSGDAVLRLQRAGFDPADKGGSSDDGGVYEANGSRITIRPKIGDVLRLD